VLELTEEDYRADKVTLLKFVKFQRVASLTVRDPPAQQGRTPSMRL
jgi:hypothetical protein